MTLTFEELVRRADEGLFIIGEAGVNHDGRLVTAKTLVDVAVNAGCDAVKFQTWITEKVYSRELSVKPEYQRRSTGDEESVYDTIKKLELPLEALVELKKYCDDRGILFFSTPDEQDSADFLIDLGVTLMKSGSQDVTNLPFLRYLARLGIPLIFSTGAATEAELSAAVSVLETERAQFMMLHCVSSYPAPLNELNLRLIPALHEKYGVPVGFSDHTLGTDAASAAVALGARVLEKHFTLAKDAPGPDHQASATPNELRHYVDVLRSIHRGLGDGVKRIMPSEEDTRNAFRRFLVTSHPIVEGSVLGADDFVFKKVSTGIEPCELDHVIGSIAATDIPGDVPVRWEFIEQRSQRSMVEHAQQRTALWLTDAAAPDWMRHFERLPDELRDVYFDAEYVRLYETDGRQAQCFIYTADASIFFYPFLLQSVPSHPGLFDITTAYGYGGPICNVADAEFIADAYANFRSEARQRGVIAELVKFHPLLENHRVVVNELTRVIPVCPIVYVDLTIDPQYRWEKIYTHANRKNIKKALRANVTVQMVAGDAEWAAFRRLYADTMVANSAGDFYHFSDEYLSRIRERLASKHILVTATLDGEVVAAMIVLLGTRYAHCHLIGTDRDALPLGVNHLLHHELILWCAGRGYQQLVIGGGRGNDDDDSLLRFKRNFSDATASFFVGESILSDAQYHDVCEEWVRANPARSQSDRVLCYRS